MRLQVFSFFLSLLAFACGKQDRKLFEKLSSADTGIDFTNSITETREHNVFTYQYYYNGNGVAIGDVNNDGLADVFVTGNQTASKLFINEGNFHFKDITQKAGVAGNNGWRTGANMVDINGDSLLDIYVCYSGFGKDEERANQLFINAGKDKDGVPRFMEKSAEYGIAAVGTYTSQSAFFDYDRDGDLDMFLLNHANEFYSPFFNTRRLRTLRHPLYGNRLYQNNNGHFIDVSETAGIFGGGNNFGLGIAVSDINLDGWPDVLVSNDFHEQDYFYLNNRNGTFKEVSQQVFAHMSRNTMGLDIADFNNDLLPDVVTLDMLPESNYRQKILQGPDEYDKYSLMVDSGYGHQNNRNMLQLHRGFTADSLPVFSEIGQLAGISNTDWSWASLFADFDNDGLKDLFVTNGYLRESTNLDFMRYEVAEALQQVKNNGLDVSTPQGYATNMPLYDLVKKMPSTRISNYMFSNRGDLSFSDQTKQWGLDEEGVSSGATYADLDNDGDLDILVCNNNDPLWVYKNNTNEIYKNNFIKIKLVGDQKNIFGLGARVIITTDSSEQLQEMNPVRGYQSSVDYVLNFGIGTQKQIKEIKVFWSADSVTIIKNPSINKLVEVKKEFAIPVIDANTNPKPSPLFTDITNESGIDFIHKENSYVDFKREYLMPYQLSRQGPKMAKADVNSDGLEDVYIGGAAGQSGILYLQVPNNKFKKAGSQPWRSDSLSEDVGCLFFDADNDGDMDLYVASGSNEWLMPGPELQDRLYVNDGKGSFNKRNDALPREVYSGSCVTASDFDKDGDMDLFVGARTFPGYYPLSAGNILLRNDFDKATGQLHFTDITKNISGDELFKVGMVTDATWSDVDKDGWPDLVVVGDWMPLVIFHNDAGKRFSNYSETAGLQKTNGWWCKILPEDIDGDGDMDFIAGNLGTNTQFKVSKEEPLITYTEDFDNNGTIDPLMTRYIQHVSYPYNSRDEVTGQLPALNKKFLHYSDYGRASIGDILTEEQIKKARKFFIYETQTSLFINEGGKFRQRVLPLEVQFSMMNGILFKDYDGDGKEDILFSGNFYPFRVQEGQCDASIGSFLKGDGNGIFKLKDYKETGLYVPGDVRDIVEVKSNQGSVIIISKNNSAVQVLKINKQN